jgi:Uma2 family endonuclease
MTALPTLPPVVPALPASNGTEVLYEVVNGHFVELPPMSTFAVVVASRLVRKLGAFADAQHLGEVVSEMLFGLDPKNEVKRRPDLAFVSYQRWPQGRPWPPTDPCPVVPELAVEVVSPNDLAEPLLQKLTEYFRAGVQLVWVIYPMLALVYVYESLTQVRGLTGADELDGGPVLPGFRLALTTLFADAPIPT